MCEPVKQDYHSDLRYDDKQIGNDDGLLRHCCAPIQIVPCDVHGHKLSSQVFSIKSGEAGASIDLECLLHNEGKSFVDRVGVMPNAHAMAKVLTGDVRELSDAAGVAWTPKPIEDLPGDYAGKPNPYHGEVIGLTKPLARAISKKAKFLWALPSLKIADTVKDTRFEAWVPG